MESDFKRKQGDPPRPPDQKPVGAAQALKLQLLNRVKLTLKVK